MKPRSSSASERHDEAKERRHREAALDETIEASFPASDPPSTNPNPDTHDDGTSVTKDDAPSER